VQSPAQDEPDKGLIGRNIILARQLADDLSQRQLAARLGIDRRQLSEWERGLWDPGLRNLRKVALALGQNIEFFLVEHPDTPPPPC
jgi:transcriptional regulator with XRE-family HTH domain